MWIVLNPSLPKRFHILLKQTALLVPKKKAVSLLDLQLGTDSWQKNGSPTSPAMPNKHHYMLTLLHKPEHGRICPRETVATRMATALPGEQGRSRARARLSRLRAGQERGACRVQLSAARGKPNRPFLLLASPIHSRLVAQGL